MRKTVRVNSSPPKAFDSFSTVLVRMMSRVKKEGKISMMVDDRTIRKERTPLKKFKIPPKTKYKHGGRERQVQFFRNTSSMASDWNAFSVSAKTLSKRAVFLESSLRESLRDSNTKTTNKQGQQAVATTHCKKKNPPFFCDRSSASIIMDPVSALLKDRLC
jgi:hypothetical protein